MGVLHDEVDRLLRQELPSAIALRPLLDAIGLGAHKSSEIAGRLQSPATSLTRALKQLQQLGYVHRDVPYGEDEKRAKRAIYRLADPFLRLWFKTVAPHRGFLRTCSPAARRKILEKVWPQLQAQAWEELCQLALPRLGLFDREWESAKRYWKGNQNEWDAVSTSLDGEVMILAECKALRRPVGKADLERMAKSLTTKPVSPGLGSRQVRKEYVLFVPSFKERPVSLPAEITVIDGNRVFAALRHID